jgi:ribosomal protein S18 acetylase RimI-like enzyme
MSLVLRRAVIADAEFLFECLRELRGGASYTPADFVEYLERHGLLSHPEFQIFVGCAGVRPVGMLTCNRFAMPRYLGFGVEIEEVVVHPRAQRQGYAEAMLQALFKRLAGDRALRKILVKTDDQLRAGGLYRKHFDVVLTTVYGRVVHYL